MSRGNEITGATGTKGKLSQDKEDAYQAVCKSIHPGKEETVLAYIGTNCNLPIPDRFVLDTLDSHAATSKNPKKTVNWILSKDSKTEAIAFATLILSNMAWRKVVADLLQMGWFTDRRFEAPLESAMNETRKVCICLLSESY